MNPTPKELETYAALAQSKQGQALLALLRQQGGARLDTAMAQAAKGDYAAAQAALSALLESPEAQALLRQLEGKL